MPGNELSFTGRVIAVVGARTFLGSALIRLLEADERYVRIIALDVTPPEEPLERAEYRRLDLVSPEAQEELTAILEGAKVDTLVHAAFLSSPTHALSWAHELEDVGTMQVLGAAHSAGIERVALTSTTLVYGASPDNPVEIRETARLEASGKPPFLAEKIRAERQLVALAKRDPSIAACVLRFAPIVGPRARSFITEALSRPIVVRMLGFDPLVQLTDEGDAAWALKLAVDAGARGAYNIASRGVLPLSTVLALLGRVPLPVPATILRPLARLLWTAQLVSTPPEMTDFLRFLCVADTERATLELGFRARHNIRDVLMGFGEGPAAASSGADDPASIEYAGAMH